MPLRKHDGSSDLTVPVPRALAGASPCASSPPLPPHLEPGTWARSRQPQPHRRGGGTHGNFLRPVRPLAPGPGRSGSHRPPDPPQLLVRLPESVTRAPRPLFGSPTPPRPARRRRLRHPPPGPVIRQPPRPRYPPGRWAWSPRASRGGRRPLPRCRAGARGPRAGQGRAACTRFPGRDGRGGGPAVSQREGRAGRPEEAAPRTARAGRGRRRGRGRRGRGRLRAL